MITELHNLFNKRGLSTSSWIVPFGINCFRLYFVFVILNPYGEQTAPLREDQSPFFYYNITIT